MFTIISFILGLILLAIPFLAVVLFKDKKIGFVFVLFFSILFHVFLAIITQILGIFYYSVIVFATILANIILLFFILKKIKFAGFKFQASSFKKFDWALMFVIIVGFLTLSQVHYNYTGKINLATDRQVGYHEVKNMQYVYPYFSDEWYSTALIKNSINSHFLPITNPYDNSFFLNLELFFHSFLAEIILILVLDPLTQYTLLSIFFNLLILVLVYLFLRINNLSKSICAISALSLLYITCGANLPGLWHLIPFNMGIIMFLILIIFVFLKNLKMVLASAILGSFFYPPLFLFYFLGLISTFFEKYKYKREILFKIIGFILLFLFVFVPVVYVLLMISPLASAINYIFSRLFFISFTAPYISQFAVYNIILLPIILLAIFGIYYVFKNKKWLFFQFLLGILMWFVYSLTASRFMVECERIVVLTSIIVTIVAGFGLSELTKYIINKKIKDRYTNFVEVLILILFLVFIPFYTQREGWRSLTLLEPKSGMQAFPKAPANNYLTKDDLRIFKNIKNARFLSIPWKGTVIGTVTDNLPVITKEGTISMGKENTVNNFLNADCVGKKTIAEKLKIDYIYLYNFDCSDFKKLDQSKENIYLYQYVHK
jgi:hypothetical protein